MTRPPLPPDSPRAAPEAEPHSAQRTAERSAAIMWQEDHAARALGVELLEVGPGTARLRMTVGKDMVNGHGSCHGGFIFTVADCAFSYACNSQNHRAVASGADISYLAPAQLGDVLTCVARVRSQGRRSGVYDVDVCNQEGRTIALFRGHSTRVKGQFFTES